ncbi:MAG: hypothetical protein LC630_01940 [Bacteroidales bacterium]|nr:hypothetical protein [Bacteroidales bacterium]
MNHKLSITIISVILTMGLNAQDRSITPSLLSPGLNTQERSAAPALRYDENHSLTWEEAISFYKALDTTYPEAKLFEMGMTDAGRPLHLFIISGDWAKIHSPEVALVLINNGIHPGEPEGIDASAQFAADILADKDGMKKYLRNCTVAIIGNSSGGKCFPNCTTA